MKILVTGATSIIGVPLIKKLLHDKHEVYAVVRPDSYNIGRLESVKHNSNLHIIQLQLENIGELGKNIQGCDICFHFGWDGAGSENRKKKEVQQKNVQDSKKVFRTALNLGCKRFIFSGSQAEYGIHEDKVTEYTECFPVSEYGKAKVDFMNWVKAYLEECLKTQEINMQYIHTRIFSIYGPEDHKETLVNSCIETFLQGESIELGDCSQLWNFLYIDDLTEAFIALMNMQQEDSVFDIYNIAGMENETKQLKLYVDKIHECCNRNGNYILGRRSPNAEGTVNLNPSIRKIQNKTGWIPKISFSDGIKMIIKQRREHSV